MPVALKILHGVEPDDEESVNRFRREAMASARLMHPNLVRATDAGILDRHLFLVTDLVDGVDLNQLMDRQGELSVANVCELGRAACEGLQYLANHNTVHRDIKPSNIMVDREGQVRVLDLGLARNNDLSNSLTFEGQLMGTLDFMSPEQALSPKDVDFHADMYSMGCTLYFLLTGTAPFEDEQHETLAAKLMAHMEILATPIEKLRKGIPKPVARIVMAMLEKDPADRPASFDEVIKVLSHYTKKHNLSQLVAGNTENKSANRLAPQPKKRTVSERRRSIATRRTSLPFVVLGTATVMGVACWTIAADRNQPVANNKVRMLPPTPQARAINPTSTANLGVEDPELPPPPPGLNQKGLKAWRYYLASPSHKAWVWDRVSGNYGYATDRDTIQDAIVEARKYGGPTCKLFSVNGEPVAAKTPPKPAPLVKGELQENTFVTEE